MVQSKDSDKSLYMIVDKRMIKLRICLFQCLCDYTVPWKELEIDARRLAKSGRVNANASDITHHEAQKFTGRSVEAGKNVLGVGFKRNPITNQGRNECLTCDTDITIEIVIRSTLGEPGAHLSKKLTRFSSVLSAHACSTADTPAGVSA